MLATLRPHLTMIRKKINGALVYCLRKMFRIVESCFGLHITRAHFYSPIPTVSELKPEVFSRTNDCSGIDFDAPGQLDRLASVSGKYLREYTPRQNSGLAQVDAFVLYAFIREKKPKNMIEVGSGESTMIALAAIRKNAEEGFACKFTAIEPYPKSYLRKIGDQDFLLIAKKVQDVDISVFLEADILFIDSSHVSKIDSDVNHEILNIVPRLKVGAMVHWHDIMIPAEYPRAWIESTTQFWNESYIVHAFMLYNKSFVIQWAAKYMQVHHPESLREKFPFFAPMEPNEQLSSFWVKRVN